jgi:hypothetical protein
MPGSVRPAVMAAIANPPHAAPPTAGAAATPGRDACLNWAPH